jgi:hypothetical protein
VGSRILTQVLVGHIVDESLSAEALAKEEGNGRFSG